MVKILERRLTIHNRLILDKDGLIIEGSPHTPTNKREERISYGQYRLYLFSRGNYIGLASDIILWGPGTLIQFDDMHYEYYIGITPWEF